MRDRPPDGEAELVIDVQWSEDWDHPAVVAREEAWDYSSESFARLAERTGMPAEELRETLDAGGVIYNRLLRAQLRPRGGELPTPGNVYLVEETATGYTAHRPCNCSICVYVATRGGLGENKLDCHDYPQRKGAGPCSDPHAVGCTCRGTLTPNSPCESCSQYVGHPEKVALVKKLVPRP